MTNQSVPTFIVCRVDEADFLRYLDLAEHFKQNAHVIVLHEIKAFNTLMTFFPKGYRFRLMIHPSLKGNSEFKAEDFDKVDRQLNQLKSVGFEDINIPIITRAVYVKFLCKSSNSNFIMNNGYMFFDATRMDVEGFIDDIPIFIKTTSNLIGVDASSEERNNFLGNHIDYVIVTALYFDELEQVYSAFGLSKANEFDFGTYFGFRFSFAGKEILAVSQHQMGMVDAAILTTELILRFSPKYVIMPGVCGGDSSTGFGDIVISNSVHLFQAGKMSESGFLPESVSEKVDEKTIQKIKHYESEIINEISKNLKKLVNRGRKTSHPFLDFVNRKIDIHFKPTVCSTMVIDKTDYFQDYLKPIDRKIVAVEMEGYGLLRAASRVSKHTKSIMIKGVMDNGENKDDAAKSFAAYVSAHFVRKLIEKEII